MIDCQVISTGSKGNAVFLNGQILIDCGVPFYKLEEAGVIKGVRYIFLTHQHSDHLNLSTLKSIIANRPSVKVFIHSEKTLLSKVFGSTSPFNTSDVSNFDFCLPGRWYKNTGITFSPFRLNHDVPNVGWKIHIQLPRGIYKIFYATDTSDLDGISARNYNLYLIEANYTEKEIVERIKDKRFSGEFVYEERVLKTHLSKEQAEKFLADNINPSTGEYVFLHKHEYSE